MDLKKIARKIIVNVAVSSGILKFAGKFTSNIVILRYHSIHNDLEKYDQIIGRSIMHTPEAFRQQMEILVRSYTPVTMNEILSYLSGEIEPPKNAVAVTFDDGYLDNLEYAAPILNEYGIPATFYITVEPIEKRVMPWFVRLRFVFSNTKRELWTDEGEGIDISLGSRSNRLTAFSRACRQCTVLNNESQKIYTQKVEKQLNVESYSNEELMLNWDQIRKLDRMGHTIGSHTMSHPNLAYLSIEDAVFEMQMSKKILERELGKPVIHFSYPNPALQPNWNEETRELAQSIGYKTAVTSDAGSVKLSDNPQKLRRMWVPSQKSEFQWYLQSTLLGRTL